MKSSIVASVLLSFAAFAVAAPSSDAHLAARQNTQSDVLIANGYRLQGEQVTLTVNYGVCQNLPANFQRQVSSIAPNDDLSCILYDGFGCTGAASTPIVGRVEDLRVPPYLFDNRAVSLNCTRR